MASNVGGHASTRQVVKKELTAFVYKPDEKAQVKKINRITNPLDRNNKLVDLNEEEERDREIIIQFMKKYAKLWKYLFQRYTAQTYNFKKKDFDDYKMKTD